MGALNKLNFELSRFFFSLFCTKYTILLFDSIDAMPNNLKITCSTEPRGVLTPVTMTHSRQLYNFAHFLDPLFFS